MLSQKVCFRKFHYPAERTFVLGMPCRGLSFLSCLGVELLKPITSKASRCLTNVMLKSTPEKLGTYIGNAAKCRPSWWPLLEPSNTCKISFPCFKKNEANEPYSGHVQVMWQNCFQTTVFLIFEEATVSFWMGNGFSWSELSSYIVKVLKWEIHNSNQYPGKEDVDTEAWGKCY